MSSSILDVVSKAVGSWVPPTRSPTANGRWIGSVLEESLRDHLKQAIPSYIERLAGATEYPDISIKDQDGTLYAFEVKATHRDQHVNNRTKSPESLAKHYDIFKEHWVIAILYRLDKATKAFSDIEVLYVELWKYTSRSFKDYSALAALGSFEYILRKRPTETAFRSEQEFRDFFNYMSQHAGPIIDRNRLARQWLTDYRKVSQAKR